MEEIVYLNGDLLPRSEARIPATDYGFLYGYGLFETMRAYGGRVFRPGSHLARLEGSALRLGIPIEIPLLEKAVRETLRANGLADARVRLTVSAGEGSLVPDPASCTRPTVLVTATRYIPPSDETYEGGFRVLVSSLRRNSASPGATMKTTCYLESLLARREARDAGADDALLLNEKGQLAEASASNVFVVSRGLLRTPPPDSGILPGITRGIVLELVSGLNIEVEETAVSLEEVVKADEVFLTNSLIEVMPVISVDGRPVGPDTPGPMTGRLAAAYKDLVRRETGK